MDKSLSKDAAILIRSLMREMGISDHIIEVASSEYISSGSVLKRLDKVGDQ